ncbi:MAG: extracellular solute-binding protein [Bacilli bacterium]
MLKRIIRKTSLALLPLLLLTGCKSQSSRDYIVFYVWGDTVELSLYERIARNFTNETGIKVQVQAPASDYYNNLNISFSSKNNAPDIFFTESGEFNGHISSRKLLNLTPYIESGDLDVKTTSNSNGEIELWDINDSYRYDGSNYGVGDYYALIKDWSTDFVVWYNKSHIDEYNLENDLEEGDDGFMEYPSETIPMSWDEFLDMSYKLRKTNRYGTMLDRVPYKHVFEWIQMSGSSPWIDGTYFNSGDPNVYKAFEFFQNLQVGSKASSPLATETTAISSGNAFANGNLSFAFFGNWAYTAYNWDSVDFEIGLCPPPVNKSKPKQSDTYAASASMVALGIYKDSSHVDDAIEFLNYYMTKGQKTMASKGFNIPGNKKVASSSDFLTSEDALLAKINNYFYNIANNYSHSLEFNRYIPQESVEAIIQKHLSVHFNNPTQLTLQEVLNNIASDIRKEID